MTAPIPHSSLLGVFGGTFDPPHLGHLSPVGQVCDRLGIRRVLYLPCARPPHRRAPQTSAEHRVAMLELAVASEPRFEVDPRELRRPGPSFTVWTLRALRSEYPDQVLCLILGSDAYQQLASWFHSHEILSLANIVVMSRPGGDAPPELIEPTESTELPELPGGASAAREFYRTSGEIRCCDITPLDISATTIRQKLSVGEDVTAAIPSDVVAYIHKHQLYEYQNQAAGVSA